MTVDDWSGLWICQSTQVQPKRTCLRASSFRCHELPRLRGPTGSRSSGCFEKWLVHGGYEDVLLIYELHGICAMDSVSCCYKHILRWDSWIYPVSINSCYQGLFQASAASAVCFVKLSNVSRFQEAPEGFVGQLASAFTWASWCKVAMGQSDQSSIFYWDQSFWSFSLLPIGSNWVSLLHCLTPQVICSCIQVQSLAGDLVVEATKNWLEESLGVFKVLSVKRIRDLREGVWGLTKSLSGCLLGTVFPRPFGRMLVQGM